MAFANGDLLAKGFLLMQFCFSERGPLDEREGMSLLFVVVTPCSGMYSGFGALCKVGIALHVALILNY